jgi:hypothetical protein
LRVNRNRQGGHSEREEVKMATVGKELADKLVALNGRWPGDPPVVRIVEYTNFAGDLCYGVEYERDIGRYSEESRYVHKPRVYWEA